MKKIDYKTAYETLLIAYHMLLEENKKLKDNNISINEKRKMYGLPPIEKKHLRKLENINCDYNYRENYYAHLENKAIVLDIITLKNWVNKIVDYLEE